jgi:hypothetical protein
LDWVESRQPTWNLSGRCWARAQTFTVRAQTLISSANETRIGLGVAWNKADPTASRDDIIDIARSLARAKALNYPFP